jgi:hypothetical protein
MERKEAQRARQTTLFDQCIITAFLRSTIGSDSQTPESTESTSLAWKDYAIPAALFLFLGCLFAYEHFFG